MKRIIVAAVATLALLAPAAACPLCKESIPESSEHQTDYDPQRQSLGYNYSIYFMLAVPFTLAGAMGFFIYRQCRKVDQSLES